MKNDLIILILGPSGAGKSTISKALANKFKRSAYIEIDNVRGMVKKGHLKPWVKGGDKELILGTYNAAALAKNFIQYDYNVIIEDVVSSKLRLDMYHKLLKGYKLKIFLLLPSRKVLAHRDSLRPKECQLGKRSLDLHDAFTQRITEENRWQVLDTSHETHEASVKRIYKLITNDKK